MPLLMARLELLIQDIIKVGGIMKLFTLATGIVLMTGCQSLTDWTHSTQDNSVELSELERQLQLESFNGHQDPTFLSHWARDPHAYMNRVTQHVQSVSHLNISDYVEAMSMRLIKNMRYVTDKTPIAVASFVPVDSTLEETNLLGIHLAESFQHNMQVLGLSVIEYKATGTIRVTDKGDFALSRDIDELKQSHPIEYVLTGTFTYKDKGVEVHAKMVGVESRAVVASSQGFIPTVVAEQLIQSTHKSGIKLVKQ